MWAVAAVLWDDTASLWAVETTMWDDATSVWAVASSMWAVAVSMWDITASMWNATRPDSAAVKCKKMRRSLENPYATYSNTDRQNQ